MTYVTEVTRRVLAGDSGAQVLALVAERARQLIGASSVWVMMPDGATPDLIRVAAASGREADPITDATLEASSSLAARAMERREPVSVSDMSSNPLVIVEARHSGFGPGLYLPMVAEDGPIGSLVVARDTGAEPYTEAEVSAVEVFASAAAVGIALGGTRDALEGVRMVLEHERIARDLHDTVIQRLFALGMGLQSAQRLATGPVQDRIRGSVEAIDEVIREIRETIFDLNRPQAAGLDLRQQVRRVASEVGDDMGFAPRVSFRGPVEVAIADRIMPDLLAVAREALTNAGRHARANRVDLVVAATADTVTLSVADDGVGLPDGPSAGHGLANMAERAVGLGGQLTVTDRRPRGTLLQWTVPTGS